MFPAHAGMNRRWAGPDHAVEVVFPAHAGMNVD